MREGETTQFCCSVISSKGGDRPHLLFLKNIYLFVSLLLFFWTALGLCCSKQASSSEMSRGCSLVALCRLLIVVVALAVEQGSR